MLDCSERSVAGGGLYPIASEESWQSWVYGKIQWKADTLDRGAWATYLWNSSLFPMLSEKGFTLRLNKNTIIRKFIWYWKAIEDNGIKNPISIPLPVPIVPIKVARGEEHTLPALHRRKLQEYRFLFDRLISYDIIENIYNYYEAEPGGFDESWTGRMLRADLVNFIWAYVDLKESIVIQNHEEEQAEADAFYKEIESSHLTLEELDKMRKRGEMDPDYIYDKHG
jgi:hypothetical protein